MAECNQEYDNQEDDEVEGATSAAAQGTAEFDLEGALGGLSERERLGVVERGPQLPVPTFGIASDGSRTPSVHDGRVDEEDVRRVQARGDFSANVHQQLTDAFGNGARVANARLVSTWHVSSQRMDHEDHGQHQRQRATWVH